MLISTAYLAHLETLLGDAYALIETQTDATNPESLYGKLMKTKALVKGGFSHQFGVATDVISGDRSTDQSYDYSPSYSVAGPTGSADANFSIFANNYAVGDNIFTITDQYDYAINGLDVNGVTLGTGDFYPVVFTLKDLSTLGGHTATLQAYRGVKQCDESTPFDQVAWPSYDTREILVARAKHLHTVQNAIDTEYTGAFPAEDVEVNDVYYVAPGDDSIEPVFEGVYDTLTAVATKNRATEFNDSLLALNTHVRVNEGVSFKTYWKTQGYQFAKNFRNLWSASMREELSTNLAVIAGTLGSTTTTPYADVVFARASQLEASTLDALSTSAPVQVQIMGISPTYSTAQVSHIIATGGTEAVLYNADDWPASGYMWIDAPEKTNADRLVQAYAKPYATLPNNVSLGAVSCLIPAWSTVRYVESHGILFATGSVTGSVAYTATQSNNYLGIACATVSSGFTTATQVVIRNV